MAHGNNAGRANYEQMRLDEEDTSLSKDISETDTDEEVSSVRVAFRSEDDKLRALQAQLQDLEDEVARKHAELDKVQDHWDRREATLCHTVQEWEKQVQVLEFEIYMMNHQVIFGRMPPKGPMCLRFVDEMPFSVTVSIVVVLNLVSMTLALMYPEAREQFFLLDHAFMGFYVMELLLRMCYYQKSFLCGPLCFVGWHWLDVLLVADGMIFLLRPQLAERNDSGSGVSDNFQYFRFLRLLRYLRAVRLIHEMFKTNMSWVESDRFQSFIMSAITANAVVMGMEVQYPGLEFLWLALEHVFLLLFTFEIIARMNFSGCVKFFTDPESYKWNILDFLIVTGGVVDQWLMPAGDAICEYMGVTEGKPDPRVDSFLRLARIARLCRVLRLVRLMKHIRPLYTLIIGVVKAMQGMSWVMVLTVTVLYIAALLGVKLVGPRGLLTAGGGEDYLAEHVNTPVEDCFPDMYDAIFNMFKVMQMDFGPMEPLFAWAPVSKYIIMLYVVVTNWAIFSILTAVICDEMAKVTQKLEEDQASVDKSHRNNKLVAQIFDRLDDDKTGEVTESQFRRLLDSDEEVHELCDAAELEPADLQEFFEILSNRREAGKELLISRATFLDGLEKEREAVNQRAMMKLEKRLDEMDGKITDGMQRMEALISQAIGEKPGPWPSSLSGTPRTAATQGQSPSWPSQSPTTARGQSLQFGVTHFPGL